MRLPWGIGEEQHLLGFQFHRQVPMLDYIVGFYCHELKLIIEIDGDSHGHELAIKNDKVRQSRIEKYGVKFIRFDDLDIKKNISRVLEEIVYWVEGISCE